MRLLTENKFTRYLAYAIGEIALIVIGILIALQISNWNEGRKDRVFERKILGDIRHALDQNLWQLNMSMECNSESVAAAEVILYHMKQNLPYDVSLESHFSKAIEYCVPTVRNAGYESLKSFGINRISNGSIKDALAIFDAGWLEQLGNRQEEYFFSTVSPELTGLFDKVAMRTEMKPFDYEELKQSKEYLSVLHTSIAYRKDQNSWYERWHKSLKDLEKIINEELEGKSDSGSRDPGSG